MVSCKRNADATNLNQQIQQLHDKGLFNGAIIITEGNDVILSKGFGYANFEAQIPFETNTSMDTGSITKNFTALAMMLLVDSKEIDLDTPVSSFIQEFPYNNITILHLLEQTSGIVSDDYVFERVQQGVSITNNTFLDFLVKDIPPLEFTPGSQFMYNGFNHRLLALLIEIISKDSYENFIRVNIAEPIDLKNWFLRPASLKDLPSDRALGYSKTVDTLLAYDSEDFEGFYGDCNLFFSAEDLSKWSNSFLVNSLYPNGKLNEILSTKSRLSEFNILHWYKLTNQEKYHFTGDWKGFYAMVYFDLGKKRSIVYLTNTNIPDWLRPALVRNINYFLDNGRSPDWDYPKALELTNREIIGDYQLKKEQKIHIFEDESSLKINTNNKTVSLFKLSSNIYYAPGVDLWIWFTKDHKKSLKIYSSSVYELNEGVKNSSQHRL